MPSKPRAPRPKRKASQAKSKQKKMPGLTVDTTNAPSPLSQGFVAPKPNPKPASTTPLQSEEPTAPPISPLTPTRIATPAFPEPHLSSRANINTAVPVVPQTYAHSSQTTQVAVPQPPPVPIEFDENPDVIALKSAIAILQIQARNAKRDIRTLSQVKTRAVGDPEGFTAALIAGELGTEGAADFEEDEEDEAGDKMDIDSSESQGFKESAKKAWPILPKPQDIARCPPINWTQYAIVGDSLDKLHKEQQERPTEGKPQILGSDGTLMFGGEGNRRPADIGVMAPYSPLKDRLDKVGVKKGGKK